MFSFIMSLPSDVRKYRTVLKFFAFVIIAGFIGVCSLLATMLVGGTLSSISVEDSDEIAIVVGTFIAFILFGAAMFLAWWANEITTQRFLAIEKILKDIQKKLDDAK